MSITIIPSPLPEGRRIDPKRRAEMWILDQLCASESQGTAIYEWSAGDGSPEVDFALWVAYLGRFAIQVKGGHYEIQNYNWLLRLPGGSVEQQPSPVYQTRDGALAMSRVVGAVTGFTIYTVAVLVFPDMDPDPGITALASQKNVYLVWRGEDLMARLAEIAQTEVVRYPPRREHIDNEVHAMMYGVPLAPPAPARRTGPEPKESVVPARMDPGPATVMINNSGPLIMHFGTPEDLAAIIASVMPVSPTEPTGRLQADPASFNEETRPPFGDLGGAALHQSPQQPPMVEQA